MGKWNHRSHRSRNQRRRSPLRWYSDRHSSSSSSAYGENDGIPVWEKRFCEVVGSVPWQKVVEASSFKSWYQGNVITWNDSACEETFHNEKKRFWSQFYGVGCDISLPDPDCFIGEVDWDTSIEPELIRDLERAYFAPPDEVNNGLKRARRDNKNWSSGCDLVPIEETRMLKTDALGKKSDGWSLSDSSSTDHLRPWKGKPSCEANDTNEIQWKSKDGDSWEKSGWDRSGHQSKKAKGFESVSAEECDNPWEAKLSCREEIVKETTWGGCSGRGWEERGWGSGGGWGNQVRERKEWRDEGYNPWKADNVGLRDYGGNAGGWQTDRVSDTRRRNWDAKRSSDGWGRQDRERDDSCGYNANYRNSRPMRDGYWNRKVNFSSK
ncbi:unnamed protein product [Microthlaspi erraticum]|uniref:Uncharacterized protein n=1 Tax=Microthlaspi erraticum TaxID=1685480 RepID=A0A6D2HSN7_9BRAS|nr:unnamed protein product [Microthlaspi erraticum]